MEYKLQNAISKMSKMYNYFEGNTAIKVLSNLTEEEKEIVLADPKVQKTIFLIDDVDILRTIFRKSPAFFQEIMFDNETIQDILVSPTKSLKRKELFANYNKKDYFFSDEKLRKLETFLHTIKSPKVHEQLISSKFFQRIIALCYEKQLDRPFFKGIDTATLFYNIINDEDIYKTRTPRKRNIIQLFNKVSDHILLPDDFDKVISKPSELLRKKRWAFKDYEKVYIDKRTVSLLDPSMLEEVLNFKNIDLDIIEDSLSKDYIAKIKEEDYNFYKIFNHLRIIARDDFNGTDYLHFKIIIKECKNNETITNKFIDFIYDTLCRNEEFTPDEISTIKKELYIRITTNSITRQDYENLFAYTDPLKTIFYLKFGKVAKRMDYLNGISIKQLLLLNVKHINQITKVLNLENEDELSITYAIAIKLYFVFGLDRTLKILNNKYGQLNRNFFDNVTSLDVKKIQLVKEGSKYLPSISNDFINFMFNNEKSNHFINMLSTPNSELNKNWSYLFNNIEDLKEKCHNVLTLKKLNILLKQISPSRDINDVSPDNFKLEGILDDVCLGNKTRKENGEIYKILLDIYDKMKRRTESSIPYIKGKSSNGYTFEMMKLNDPIAFILGYKGNCCIRVGDIAHEHLLHATLCRNGRILIIYDQNNDIAAFSPLKRNGEVLIANSIECLHKKKNEKAIQAFEEAISCIVKTSQSNPEEKEPINLVCIGTESYARPTGTPFPKNIETPTIFEKDDPTYKRTDSYHHELTIVYKSPKLDFNDIKYGNPKCSYQDEREPIASCDFNNANETQIEEVLKRINAVRYTNCELEDLENFKLSRQYGIQYCMYNDDWYILTTYDGTIYGDYIPNDTRAIKEYNVALDKFKEEFAKDKDIIVKKLK